jgi:periplasmic divalent cation tolerance protein
MTQLIVTFCTCPNKDSAEKIARQLVTDGLAGCVNIIPSLTSVYLWEGKIESADECLLLIKSAPEAYQKIEASIIAEHPYDLPEIIALPTAAAYPEYVNWIHSCHSAS